MTEDIYFLDEGIVGITAASVGISRQRWTSVNEKALKNNLHVRIMKSNRFDHLPIISKNNFVLEYFQTVIPNDYGKIKRCKIKYDDVVPLDTNIKYIIEKFAETGKTFYFLSFNKNISGLITLSNLNCRKVQVYIFSLICELERELGDFINSFLSAGQIENWVKSKIKSKVITDKYYIMMKNFRKLMSLDLENQLTEHFYLVDFFNLINDFKLYNKLNFTGNQWKNQNSINEIRIRVAHPTRSLLDKDNDINKLKERLDKINDLIFRLITLKKEVSASTAVIAE
ncbi:MAG: hypothetical protein JW917_10030 [Ignavibacteria bacterium]|nr:hypothetical protein [Ignavibacteria bacterium]